MNAYKAIDEADHQGGDVSKLVDSLNQVIDASKIGVLNNQDAIRILNSIIEEAEKIKQQGIEEQNLRIVIIALNSMLVIGLCYVVWRYFPRFYWRMWLKYRGHWIIE